jgi:hypothetical protein
MGTCVLCTMNSWQQAPHPRPAVPQQASFVTRYRLRRRIVKALILVQGALDHRSELELLVHIIQSRSRWFVVMGNCLRHDRESLHSYSNANRVPFLRRHCLEGPSTGHGCLIPADSTHFVQLALDPHEERGEQKLARMVQGRADVDRKCCAGAIEGQQAQSDLCGQNRGTSTQPMPEQCIHVVRPGTQAFRVSAAFSADILGDTFNQIAYSITRTTLGIDLICSVLYRSSLAKTPVLSAFSDIPRCMAWT